MNKYPAWLNTLVLVVVLAGILFALPNIYGSGPAVQLADTDGEPISEGQLDNFVRELESAGITPEAAYISDDRGVIRFDEGMDQQRANTLLGQRHDGETNVAMTLAPKLPEWVRSLGLNPMSLGLDLRGGIYVLLEVDMATAIGKRMESYRQDIDDRLREARIRRQVNVNGDRINIRLRDAEDLEAARDIAQEADADLIIADGADGRSLNVRMSEQQIKDRQDFAIQQNMTTLRNRVDQLGVAEPLVQRQGESRIVVQLPGVQDPNELSGILTATATVEFRMVDPSGNLPGSRRYNGRGSEPAQVLKREVIASGDEIVDASSGTDQYGQPAVHITLDSAGGERMLANTSENVGKLMSTVFIEYDEKVVTRNGERVVQRFKTEEIISTATIQGVFKNRFQVTGLNTAEARELAVLLRAGALAAPVYKVDERTIGATLGKENIEKGFKAIQIGFLAVIVFMAVYYRWFGMIANLALLSNLVFIVALLSLLQASLTLPGIAGIVLTVGMAVDANVLIFERIREEITAGNTIQNSIHAGYEKAIKGFAVTLSLGIITSMFTAIIGTRTVVNLVFGGRRLQTLPI